MSRIQLIPCPIHLTKDESSVMSDAGIVPLKILIITARDQRGCDTKYNSRIASRGSGGGTWVLVPKGNYYVVYEVTEVGVHHRSTAPFPMGETVGGRAIDIALYGIFSPVLLPDGLSMVQVHMLERVVLDEHLYRDYRAIIVSEIHAVVRQTDHEICLAVQRKPSGIDHVPNILIGYVEVSCVANAVGHCRVWLKDSANVGNWPSRMVCHCISNRPIPSLFP